MFSNNSFHCTSSQNWFQRVILRRPCIDANKWFAPNLLLLSGSLVGGAFPPSWVNQDSFPSLLGLDTDEATWQLSTGADAWREAVCLNQELFSSRLRLQQLRGRLNKYAADGTNGGDFNMTLVADSLLPRLRVNRTLDGICANPGAGRAIGFVWGAFFGLVSAILVLYACCVGRTGMLAGTSAAQSNSYSMWPWVDNIYSKFVQPWLGIFSLLIYWVDVAADVVVISSVWGNWPGYVLVLILLCEYTIAWCILVRFAARSFLARYTRLQALCICAALIACLPGLDSFVFLCAVGIPSKAVTSRLNVKEYQYMRDMVRVVVATIPTMVLQSVVFVQGSNPTTGWYLAKRTVIVSMALSALQAVKVLALILAMHRGLALAYFWELGQGKTLEAESGASSKHRSEHGGLVEMRSGSSTSGAVC